MDRLKGEREIDLEGVEGLVTDRLLTKKSKDQIRVEYQYKQVIEALSCLQADFTLLLKAFNDRLSYDREKEVAFERLYAENEELKQDTELNRFKSIYIDLILLIDRMNNIYNDKLSAKEQNKEFLDMLSNLSREVLEILYRRGVDLVVSDNDYYDPKVQQAVGIVPTNNPAEEGRVVEMVRHGFRCKDVLIRPEEVVIKKYETV
ncbi:MAG: nucleotide exchange factor GrpE [Bacillota bacterium]|jgi:molecular chaperone GrpE (heat shock protein)